MDGSSRTLLHPNGHNEDADSERGLQAPPNAPATSQARGSISENVGAHVHGQLPIISHEWTQSSPSPQLETSQYHNQEQFQRIHNWLLSSPPPRHAISYYPQYALPAPTMHYLRQPVNLQQPNTNSHSVTVRGLDAEDLRLRLEEVARQRQILNAGQISGGMTIENQQNVAPVEYDSHLSTGSVQPAQHPGAPHEPPPHIAGHPSNDFEKQVFDFISGWVQRCAQMSIPLDVFDRYMHELIDNYMKDIPLHLNGLQTDVIALVVNLRRQYRVNSETSSQASSSRMLHATQTSMLDSDISIQSTSSEQYQFHQLPDSTNPLDRQALNSVSSSEFQDQRIAAPGNSESDGHRDRSGGQLEAAASIDQPLSVDVGNQDGKFWIDYPQESMLALSKKLLCLSYSVIKKRNYLMSASNLQNQNPNNNPLQPVMVRHAGAHFAPEISSTNHHPGSIGSMLGQPQLNEGLNGRMWRVNDEFGRPFQPGPLGVSAWPPLPLCLLGSEQALPSSQRSQQTENIPKEKCNCTPFGDQTVVFAQSCGDVIDMRCNRLSHNRIVYRQHTGYRIFYERTPEGYVDVFIRQPSGRIDVMCTEPSGRLHILFKRPYRELDTFCKDHETCDLSRSHLSFIKSYVHKILTNPEVRDG